jgi:hypothetical protein
MKANGRTVVSAALAGTFLALLYLGRAHPGCSNIQHLPPLTDLGPGQTYNGYEGGLYPGGSNVRPAAHDARGQSIAQSIRPLDANGNYDPNGKIVLTIVSVSNGYGTWHTGDTPQTDTGNGMAYLGPFPSYTFINRANALPNKNPKLFVAYGFEYQLPGWRYQVGDNDASNINSAFYPTLDYALSQQGLTPKQVQVVWCFFVETMPIDQQNASGPITFPADAQAAKALRIDILHNIQTRYPNVKIIYNSTKGYMYQSLADGGNVGGPVEPWNHDAAWGVKWAIEDQINGVSDVRPWLAWGPYFWSYGDGTPRHWDGFVWTCADIMDNGTNIHPSPSGMDKMSAMLIDFFTTDPTATPWFLGSGGGTTGTSGSTTAAP